MRAGELAPDFIARAQAVPLQDTPDGLALAMADPTDEYTIKAVRLAAGKPVLPWAAVPSELNAAIERLYSRGGRAPADANANGGAGPAREDVKRLSDFASDEPVIRYVNWLIGHAAASRASDIHIEASADRVVQRLRVDGLLRDVAPPPAGLHDNIISRLKIMARLNIAEKRLPQDGRIRIEVAGPRDRRPRVDHPDGPRRRHRHAAPRQGPHGRSTSPELGMLADIYKQLQAADRPCRTASCSSPARPARGKTTTLYSALQRDQRTRRARSSPSRTRSNTSSRASARFRCTPKIGLTFADAACASILRHDPDMILVGEIRDLETAEIAIQASLTGHMVLQHAAHQRRRRRLHPDDRHGRRAVPRRARSKGVMAQRLVRSLCPECRVPYRPEGRLLDRPEFAGGGLLYRPGGCEACGGTGYRGRNAIAELLVFDDELARCVVTGADAATLAEAARRGGYADLYSDGLVKAAAGITSLDEIWRVVGAA